MEAALWWVLLMALNAVFISTVSVLEVLVGAGLALLGAVAAPVARRAAGARVGRTAGWAAALWKLPRTMLTDLGRLVVLVARPRAAEPLFRTIELGTGAAWSCALLSATPGAFVAEVSPAGSAPRRVLLHSLDDRPSPLERAVRAR
ncbi:hypothetical protein [Kitasatospora sp. McL0602]|uniref:hypothetical protein n=1 Tax=Kitasatospora sp. McL0602 TaxID=3439530 RepID=UPI003F88B949